MAYTHKPEHDIFGKWLKKWKNEDKLDKIKQFRAELEREKSKISSEEYQEAKDYLDKKETELKENHIYSKNKMNTPESIIKKIIKEELALFEKKKKKDADIELDLDTPEADAKVATDDAVAADAAAMDAGADAVAADADMALGGDSNDIGKHLQAALEAAKNLPTSETKDKLIRQIGNTALFFLKTQIPTGGQA